MCKSEFNSFYLSLSNIVTLILHEGAGQVIVRWRKGRVVPWALDAVAGYVHLLENKEREKNEINGNSLLVFVIAEDVNVVQEQVEDADD